MPVLYWALFFVMAFCLVRSWIFIGQAKAAGRVIAKAKAFSRLKNNAKQKILFAGDSTAVGVGASRPEKSVPGLFASAFLNSSINNIGVSGLRLAQLDQSWNEIDKYDLVMLHIGANDIVHFTSFKAVEESLVTVLKKAKQVGKTVVVLHGGNLGSCRVFPLPLRWVYSYRTKQFQKIYSKVAAKEGVIYVDMYTPLKDFPQSRGGVSTYAKDSFHPSDEGYQIWFELIGKALADNKLVFSS